MAFTPYVPDISSQSDFTPYNPNLTPDQSSTVLGHSNGLLGNMMQAGQNLANTYGDVAAGAGKQVLQTSENIGGNVLAAEGKGIQDMTGKPLPGGDPRQSGMNLQPETTAQKVGNVGATVGEFFAPGGLEGDVAGKGASLIDKIPDALGLAGKAASAVTGALKTALQGVISGTSMGAVTAAQTADPNQVQQNAEFGAGAGALSGVLKIFGPDALTALNKQGFKLSPSQEAKTQKITQTAAQFMTDNGITGTEPAKVRQLTGITSNMENVLQSSLPKDISVPKAEIVSSINTSVESLKNSDPAVYAQARNKANEAIKVLNGATSDSQFTKGGTISVQDALAGKRSWASMAFKTAQKGKQDPTVSNEGAYAVEQAYQLGLENTLDRMGTNAITIPNSMQPMFGGKSQVTLSEFNGVYKNAINAKNLMNVAQFKSDAGLFGRMFGLLAGRMIGNVILPGVGGEVIGMGVGEATANRAAGIARWAGEKGIASPDWPTGAAKITEGLDQNQGPSQ